MARCGLEHIWCFLLFLFSIIVLSIQSKTTLVDVKIGSQNLCEQMQGELYKYESIYRYRVRINLTDDGFNSCPANFVCGLQMALSDPFEAVSNQLCVDVKDVVAIPEHFTVNISNEHGNIRQLFPGSFRFKRSVDTVYCGSKPGHYMSLMLTAVPSTPVCLSLLVGDLTTLGTVVMKQTEPICHISNDNCPRSLKCGGSFDMTTMLKFTLSTTFSDDCSMTIVPKFHDRRTRTCLELEYVSKDFVCNGEITIVRGDVEFLQINLPSNSQVDGRSKCYDFSYPEGEEYPKMILSTNHWSCSGEMAMRLRFQNLGSGSDNDSNRDDESTKVRNLYMAVFISVISVCVLIMGLTCLCCLRMRARRLRQARAAARRGPPAVNAGFNDSMDPSALWSSTSSSQVFGLPTYEEVTAGASHPASSDQDKPPAYEALYENGGIELAVGTPPQSTENNAPVESTVSNVSTSTNSEVAGPPPYTLPSIPPSCVEPSAPPGEHD